MSRELREKLRELEGQLATVTEERARMQREYNSGLEVFSAYFDQADTDRKRARLTRLADQLAQIEERLAALRRQLPDADALAGAQRSAAVQDRRADIARTRFRESGERFLEALGLAERTGREFIAAKQEAVTATGALRELVSHYGLEREVPPLPTLSQSTARLASNLAAAIVELAAGDPPSKVVESYLADARRIDALASA